jgi:hypothetical protein
MRRLVAALLLTAAAASGCACGPVPPDGWPDVPIRDAPPPQDCAEYPSPWIDVYPTTPAALSTPTVFGSGAYSPVLVDQELFLSAGIIRGAGSIARRTEGIFSYSLDGTERLIWEEWAFGAQVLGSLIISSPYGPAFRVAELEPPGAPLWELDIYARFPETALNTLGNFHVLGPAENVALLRYSRRAGDIDAETPFTFYRGHLWTRDGVELTPPDGIPFEENIEIIATAPAFDSVSVNAAGEVFYAAERPPMGVPFPTAVAMRVIRRAPDLSLAMVSEPIVDPEANPPDVSTYLSGLWGAATADGAYVAYAIARPAVGLPPVSHFVRVERDGSIGWRYTTMGYGPRGGDELSRSVAEMDGGIVGLVTDGSLAADLRLYLVTADGRRPLGPDGRQIAALVGYGEEHRGTYGGVVPDGEGGVFFDIALNDRSFVGRLDAAGDLVWGPVRTFLDPGHQWLLADGVGGFWIIAGSVQHFDALGRPLYGRRTAICYGGGSRMTTVIFDYTDGGVPDADAPPLDAGPDDAPGPLDAPLDFDADLDAAADPDAGMAGG